MKPITTSPQAIAVVVRRLTTVGGPAVAQAPRVLLESNALPAALTRRGWFAARVDRAPLFDKATLLHGFYQAGCFPAYFGFNWDALADLLSDLSWLQAQDREPVGFAFFIAHSQVLAERSPETLTTLTELVTDVAAARLAANRPPLVLVLEQMNDEERKTKNEG